MLTKGLLEIKPGDKFLVVNVKCCKTNVVVQERVNQTIVFIATWYIALEKEQEGLEL